MPFLVPITAAWILLIAGVMAYYFLRVAPIDRRRSFDSDGHRATFQGPPAAGPSPSFAQTTAPRVLPTYDLSVYPTDRAA